MQDKDHESGEYLRRRQGENGGDKRVRNDSSSDEEVRQRTEQESPFTLPRPKPKQRRVVSNPERVDTRQLGDLEEETRVDTRGNNGGSRRRRKQWQVEVKQLVQKGQRKQQRRGRTSAERRESARQPLLVERRQLQLEVATGQLEQESLHSRIRVMEKQMEKDRADMRLLRIHMEEAAEERDTLREEIKARKKASKGGRRKHAPVAGYSRWTCVTCRKEQMTTTAQWLWRRCADCVEAGMAGDLDDAVEEDAQRELQEKRSSLEITISELEHKLRNLSAEYAAEQQLQEEWRRGEVMQEHRRHIAEAEDRVRQAQAMEWEVRRDATQARKVLQRTQRELWEYECNGRVREALTSQGAWVLVDNGAEVQAAMDRAIEGVQGLERRTVAGMAVYSYKEVTTKAFKVPGGLIDEETMEDAVRQACLRRDCRGLVVDAEGVVARPLHKFFTIGQVADTQMDSEFSRLGVVEATMKLDGVMVYGVLVGTEMQLWTRGGPSQQGKNAMRFAVGTLLANYMGLLSEVDTMGCTAIFEWVGRQVRIKAKEKDAGLILLQVRNKLTGEYMHWEQRAALAAQYKVECAHRFAPLEGITVAEAQSMVRNMQTREEGFVLRLENGQMVKLKTQWWEQAGYHRYMRWWDDKQRDAEVLRYAKQHSRMQKQELRAVLKGWPGNLSPGQVFTVVPGVEKVEAFIARATGKRGAVVLSFTGIEEKAKAVAGLDQSALGLTLVDAHSRKSSSNSWHQIRTWHRKTWMNLAMAQAAERATVGGADWQDAVATEIAEQMMAQIFGT